jgi:hypothetical protein
MYIMDREMVGKDSEGIVSSVTETSQNFHGGTEDIRVHVKLADGRIASRNVLPCYQIAGCHDRDARAHTSVCTTLV